MEDTVHAPSTPSDGGRAAHERWIALRDDPEGLKAVLDALEPQLSRHPYSERSVEGVGVGMTGVDGDEDTADEDDSSAEPDNSGCTFSLGAGGGKEAARVSTFARI